MFTGIVQGLCRITAIEDKTGLRVLSIDMHGYFEGLELGASVAINGVCLTATDISPPVVKFDVIQESLRLTNLAGLQVGDLVNVERSFQVGDEVGGHIVSGHIIGTAAVSRIEAAENERQIFLRVEPLWMKYLHHKGFAAFDGASLTLASVNENALEVSVALIPETIARTTLGRVEVGDRVNLEVDAQTQAVVETVERMMSSPNWQERLKQMG